MKKVLVVLVGWLFLLFLLFSRNSKFPKKNLEQKGRVILGYVDVLVPVSRCSRDQIICT